MPRKKTNEEFRVEVYELVKDEYYCKENHIDLIRIPYWEYENIKSVLSGEDLLHIKEMKNI